jgi:hypothetical protein
LGLFDKTSRQPRNLGGFASTLTSLEGEELSADAGERCHTAISNQQEPWGKPQGDT